jgi:LysM repeat protein
LTPTPTPTPIVHVVQAGEVLLGIARNYAVTLRELLAANGISEAHILHPGDELIIPASGQRPTPTPLPDQTIHVVQQGDKLGDIAVRYNISERRIRQANDMAADDAIQVGDELVIPLDNTLTPEAVAAATATSTATSTPTPGPPYAAPQLLYPADDAIIKGGDTAVMLQWASVGILLEDEWYALEVDYLGESRSGEETEITVYTRVTSWRLPAEWYPGPDAEQNRFQWKVDVVRRTASQAGADAMRRARSQERVDLLSTPSYVRHFRWE